MSRLAILLSALLVIGAGAPGASAQQGTGGGTIYFLGSGNVWSMTSSGTNVTQLLNWGYFNVASRAPHNGHRWYLTTLSIPGEFYPDGTQRFEMFAIRGDYDNVLNNNSETRVQLTNDPTLQPYFGWFGSTQWLPGDLGGSFRASRWSGSTRVEGGLYTVNLVYRADGNIIGIVAPPTTPALAFPLDGSGLPMVGRHSWGLSTTQLAYIDSPETGLWIANLSTGTRTRIYTGGAVGYVDWSQDGTKILFGSGTIRTIRPSGSGLKTVIGPRYVNNVWVSGFGHAYFSPTSSHITCVGIMNLAGGQDNDVIRATSNGGAVTNLTNTPALVELPVGWR